jgi:hypothetical protein
MPAEIWTSQCLGRHFKWSALRTSCLTQQTKKLSVPPSFGEWFTNNLGTCASLSTTYLVHAWWGNTSFSPHCQTAPEPDFRRKVDRSQSSVNWPTQSSGLLALGTLKVSMCSVQISDLEVLHQRVENACQEILPGIFDRVRTSVRRRPESCVEKHGNHTEHAL